MSESEESFRAWLDRWAAALGHEVTALEMREDGCRFAMRPVGELAIEIAREKEQAAAQVQKAAQPARGGEQVGMFGGSGSGRRKGRRR